MEYPTTAPTLEEDDPDLAAVLDALARTYATGEALRPAMMRLDERRNARPRQRPHRAHKANGTPAQDESAA